MNYKPDSPLEWQLLSSRRGEALPLFNVRFDRLRHPTEQASFERLVLESVDWVNVVAIEASANDSNDRSFGDLVMIRQYRFGVGYTTLETPGGMVDAGEDSLTAGKRELLEETGYGGGEWHYLGAVEPNPAIHNHLCHHWLARGVTPVAPQDPGEGEVIRVELMSAAAVREAVAGGELKHVLALSALSRVMDLFEHLTSVR